MSFALTRFKVVPHDLYRIHGKVRVRLFDQQLDKYLTLKSSQVVPVKPPPLPKLHVGELSEQVRFCKYSNLKYAGTFGN
jgi:hypothetical protein